MKQTVFLICIFLSVNIFAQPHNLASYQQDYLMKIAKATDLIKLDGELNETSWQSAHNINITALHFPVDTGNGSRLTTVKATYDANFLYFAVTSFDTNYYVIQTLKRDVNPAESDGIGIILDPVNVKTNGFLFIVNPYNVQTDDMLSGSNFGSLNLSWDNKWYSQTKRLPDRWIVEVAIPFKTLRYEASKTTWGINFVRSDRKNNEFVTWTWIPVNFPPHDLGYTGTMLWDEAPPKPGSNISVIPYITGSVASNPEDGEETDGELKQGLDAKIALSSKLNLDLTINPDFSQIEVDQQVTNLTRFSIYFPERRTFFIENADLFTQYGYPGTYPFYSRTIGLDEDRNRIPIYAGARLTGNLDNNTRIGIMNMQTGKEGDFPAQNYTAVSVARRVLGRSIVKGYYLGREAFLNKEQKQQNPMDRFGRNAGFDVSYKNNTGEVQAWYAFNQSWKYGINTQDHFMYGGGGYFGRKFTGFINFTQVGTNYYADMGFMQRIENYDAEKDTVIRLGYKSISSSASYTMFPKKGTLINHKITMRNYLVWNPDGSLNERVLDLNYQLNFKNTSDLQFVFNNNDLRLLFPISFTDNGDPLPMGTYQYSNYQVKYQSDKRKKFIYSAALLRGGFYNGTNHQYLAELLFRAQPWGNFSVRFERNALEFPDPYGSTSLYLIAPRIEINFNNNLFWTTFIQYNTQENNFNINSRFQWRYKPMSDIFLVYTDNYFSDPFMKNRNRAVVFKMNYWLNL